MNRDTINEIAKNTMSYRKSHLHREKGFIYYHCQRVANISLSLRRELFPDEDSMDDIIYAAAMLHDVTKGIEPHQETGAVLVKSLLKDECSPEQLEFISDIIALHNVRNHEELPFYIKLVQDADMLDHFGSMNIWTKFLGSAHSEESVWETLRFWDSGEHKQFLVKARSQLNYSRSKDIFDQKLKFEQQFHERFKLECNGEVDFS
ncbi:HD domain-containing protein [Paenibacillus sp. MMS20-IR301]|uniref:HD domain-containing protein n=1 Tax=Paenibacillus sp. MMS20-IR301 TaxID=2895946 RepID=UPI0028EE813F|nr:HD domain-containing protein [Paenibacillus sp. MMS20-IR301]WNS45291.1 HD domain-containing protein [Paenibacillus sp. MMS20-IR301]